MQGLTVPASVTKRKQACKSCRHRKKKCDGERPRCSLCRKWDIKCEYSVPASETASTTPPSTQFFETPFPTQSEVNASIGVGEYLDFRNFPGLEFNMPNTNNISIASDVLPPINPETMAYLPTPEIDDVFPGTETLFDTPTFEHPLSRATQQEPSVGNSLPPDSVLYELVTLFFTHVHTYFPIFHEATLFSEIHDPLFRTEAAVFLYAICAVSSPYHHSPSIQAQAPQWFNHAKELYEGTTRYPKKPIRTLQAAILICYHGFVTGDFSASCLIAAKAWRQVCSINVNRLDVKDDEDDDIFGLKSRKELGAVEEEELRRTLWLLFIMDREMAWPTGMPCAVDERSFMVDSPMEDGVFQSMSNQTPASYSPRTASTYDLKSLMISSPSEPMNLFHYICTAHVLLGRICTHIHSTSDPPSSPPYATTCTDLDTFLVKFRLNLPRAATNVLDASPGIRHQVVWLNLVLNTCAILLSYRTAGTDDAKSKEEFTKAMVGAKSTVKLIRDASRIDIDLLINGHVGGAMYLAAVVLLIELRLGNQTSTFPSSATPDSDASTSTAAPEHASQNLQSDLDIFILVFKRMEEHFPFLGFKFRTALERDMERDIESVRSLRERGVKGMLADCSTWGDVAEKARSRGWEVT